MSRSKVPKNPSKELQGDVQHMRAVDGDSLEGFDGRGQKIRFRLYGVDAPELAQEYGRDAQAFLRTMIQKLSLKGDFKIMGVDRFGRHLVVLPHVNGHSGNVELVHYGFAWCLKDSLPECEHLQLIARQERRGLWQHPSPLPPWKWRATHPRRE
ncbi:MAG: thermonuclease family protein [Bdellovibrionales bacterium]|nr:thermonuclease family protein [Bdellovibrionales bacterium]